jgi:cytochrome c oxidase subunit IV
MTVPLSTAGSVKAARLSLPFRRGLKMRFTSGTGSEVQMAYAEGTSMLYLEIRCVMLSKGAGVQGLQNGSISVIGVAVLALLILAAVFVHSRWAALLALPALLFPVIFLLDLQYWLANFGTNLDPTAALSSSVKPFVPKVLGVGMIAQFKTEAGPAAGLWLAITASLLILAGLYFHRRAYKPLVDATAIHE